MKSELVIPTGDIDAGAQVLATVLGQYPVLVTNHVGAGRGVYLGAGYSFGDVRDGVPNELLQKCRRLGGGLQQRADVHLRGGAWRNADARHGNAGGCFARAAKHALALTSALARR